MSARLVRDERGAIALLALFMAVFLTALVYYVAGIGESVLQRERMQDAADAAAFSAAVLHARGMNAIVLVNMVMAALLAVLVSLKLVELLVTIALLAIALASFFAPGLASAIPGLADVRQQVKDAHDAVRPGIYDALEALHVAARGIRVLIPAASQLRVVESVRAHYDPPALRAFALPAGTTLPTQDGSFASLCDRAGEFTGDLTGWALGELIPSAVADLVGDAISDLSQSRADWFCGASEHAPRTKVKHTYRYPILPSRARCQALDPSQQQAEYSAEAQRDACEHAERDEQDSLPDEDTGGCTIRCEPDGPYALAAAAARSACAPAPHDDELRNFSWQARRYVRTYAWTRTGWSRASSDEEEERTARYSLENGDRRPCGEPGSAVSREWQLSTHDAETGAPVALCSNAEPPSLAGRAGVTRRVWHVDVTRIFGCERTVEHRYDLSAAGGADPLDAQSAEDKVPQELLAGIALGDEPLQIRAAVIGRLPPAGPEGVLKVATWRAADDPALASAALDPRELGRVAIAQAEYFYADDDGETPPADFMWSMRWQARLRRFRAPLSDTAPPRSAGAVPLTDAVRDDGDGREDRFGFAAEPRPGSLLEACATAFAALNENDRKEPSPCIALEHVLNTESLH